MTEMTHKTNFEEQENIKATGNRFRVPVLNGLKIIVL
jgi:hypothetical protein